MQTNVQNCEMNGSERIIQQIAELKGWKGKLLAQLRGLILESESDIVEEWKWGAAVWSKGGTICSAILFRHHIQLYFFKGASLADPNGLFNAERDGSVSRAIDFKKGSEIETTAFQELVREAITYNLIGDLFAKTDSLQLLAQEG